MTPEVVSKLEHAFALGCSDTEACLYAGISRSSLFRYEMENPEFRNRKEELKETPVLLARQTILKHISQPQTAQWFLERKLKGEFSARQEVEHTGQITHVIDVEDKRYRTILEREATRVATGGPEQSPQLLPNSGHEIRSELAPPSDSSEAGDSVTESTQQPEIESDSGTSTEARQERDSDHQVPSVGTGQAS